MIRVVLTSPYAGRGFWPLCAWRRWCNVRYARQCLRHSVMRDEAPIASHLLLTQRGVLRDWQPAERSRGLEAGHAWMAAAELAAVYIDRGVSSGMVYGIDEAARAGLEIEYRKLQGPMTPVEAEQCRLLTRNAGRRAASI